MVYRHFGPKTLWQATGYVRTCGSADFGTGSGENYGVKVCDKSAVGIRRFCNLPTTENDVLSEKET